MALTSFAPRLRWFLRALGGNPLIRFSDRLEALSILAVLMTALIVVPFAAGVGQQTYDAGMRTVHEQASSRHTVETTVLKGSSGMPADFESPPPVTVQWRDGNEMRTADVLSADTVRAGGHMTIWVDETGKPVSPPMTATDAKMQSLGASWTVWVTAVAFVALMAFVFRRGLDRMRSRSWDREIQLLAHNDDGWANRHI